MPMKKDLKLDQYDISPYAYRELHNFCLQYPEKKRRLRELESPFAGRGAATPPPDGPPGRRPWRRTSPLSKKRPARRRARRPPIWWRR